MRAAEGSAVGNDREPLQGSCRDDQYTKICSCFEYCMCKVDKAKCTELCELVTLEGIVGYSGTPTHIGISPL